MTPAARAGAALVAATAAAGLALQIRDVYQFTGAIGPTLWLMARYFTVTTGLIVLVVFVTTAAAGLARPWLVAGTALSTLLVGIVNALLLRGPSRLFAYWRPDDLLLHVGLPVLVPLFWMVATPKGALRLRDPFLWGLYPLSYLAYALVRGGTEGRYAYPFIDVARFGWPHVAIMAAIISAGFIGVGLLWVVVDRAWPREARQEVV